MTLKTSSRHRLRLPLAMLLISLLTACGFPASEPTTYSLTRELTDDAAGYRLRLWNYSESMLDPPGYFLEVVESGRPTQPNAGRTIVWLDGTDELPTLTWEKGCYKLAVTWVGHATRFEQRNWLLFLFYGSGVELKNGDSWTEMIAQKPVCFRFDKLTKDATVL